MELSSQVRTVLITGGSAGFGKSLVPLFARAGWRVITTSRNPETLQALKKEWKSFSEQVVPLELNLTQPESRQRLVDEVIRLGGIDCLVNNAGVGVYGAFEDLSEAQLRMQMEVNFFGTAMLTHALLPTLRRRQGRIINLSSVLGFVGLPLTSAYCASKFAIEGWSESLRYELAAHQVKVVIVEPGSFPTRFSESVIWGERSGAESSPYRHAFAAYRRYRESKRKPGVLDPVLRAVYQAASVGRPRFRYRCGVEPRLLYRIKKWVPEWLYFKLLDWSFARIFSRPV